MSNRVIAFAIIGVTILSLFFCTKTVDPVAQLHQKYEEDLLTLTERVLHFDVNIKSGFNPKSLQKEFLELRLHYKKIEAFTEYFMPTTSRMVNGAPLDEIEQEENVVFEPGGFQVIEGIIYTKNIDQAELQRHTKKLLVNLKRLNMLWKDISFTDEHVFDALRMELFRIMTLGVTGFDAPVSGNALAESRLALNSFEEYIQYYKTKLTGYNSLELKLKAAQEYLKKPVSFNNFNRANFYLKYMNPLCRELKIVQQSSDIKFIDVPRLLSADAASLFDKTAFNADALVDQPGLKQNKDRRTLGGKLFFDAAISSNGKTSCASCHHPDKAFTDGLKTSVGVHQKNIQRNSPTLLYASLQQSLFYDLRSPSLENQIMDVIQNLDEMHGSLPNVINMINSDSGYKKLYKKAFPQDTIVNAVGVQNSLAIFVRSLNPFNSKFDAYMRGDSKAMDTKQINGFNIFMGKGKCGTCHFMPLFNGTVPPAYQNTESEVLGVTQHADFKHPVLDDDLGRGKFNSFPQWQHSFKTPTLRNISLTAPYMHNGAFSSLNEVMDFYNEGGGVGLGLKVPNQTLSADKLNLNKQEIDAVIAFMAALEDKQ